MLLEQGHIYRGIPGFHHYVCVCMCLCVLHQHTLKTIMKVIMNVFNLRQRKVSFPSFWIVMAKFFFLRKHFQSEKETSKLWEGVIRLQLYQGGRVLTCHTSEISSEVIWGLGAGLCLIHSPRNTCHTLRIKIRLLTWQHLLAPTLTTTQRLRLPAHHTKTLTWSRHRRKNKKRYLLPAKLLCLRNVYCGCQKLKFQRKGKLD